MGNDTPALTCHKAGDHAAADEIERIRSSGGAPEIDAQLYAAVIYPITGLHGDALYPEQRARLADAIVAKIKERGLLPQPPDGGAG